MSASNEGNLPPLTPPPSVSTAIPLSPSPPLLDLDSPSPVNKPEDDHSEESDLSQLGRILLSTSGKMFNTKLMNEMMSLNTDEHATHFVLFTTHGTLLAHDEKINVPKTRSFAALVGRVWRNYQEVMAKGIKPNATNDIQHVKTIKLIYESDDPKVLLAMILEWEGTVAVVRKVKAKVLIAAQKDIEDFDGEEDQLGKKIQAMKLTSSKDEGEKGKGKEKGDEAAVKETADEQVQGDEASSDAHSKEQTKAGNGQKGDEEPKKEELTGPSKVHILGLRARALAEAVVEEWSEEVPADFY